MFGEIAVFLYRHARVAVLWLSLLGGVAALYAAVDSSGMNQAISDGLISATRVVTNAATAVPRSVARINAAIEASMDGSGIASFMFWLAGFDKLLEILEIIIANITVVVDLVVGLGGSTLVFAGALWTLKKLQMFVVAASGGDMNGTQMVN